MVNKSTHEGFRRELFVPVMKSAEGKYIAVLSDNSTDRDDEIVGKSCIEKLGQDMGYIAGLVDHDNSVLKMVAEWVNRQVVEIDEHTALIAEPKFFKSNPNAMIIQGMLDEGAKIGISIGAIVKDYDEIEGSRIYKELELLEASFVAIPSNRHGRCMAVAKSYSYKTKEGHNMDLTQKDVDSAVEKATKELNDDFSKKLEAKDSEISKLKKELEDAQSEAEKAKEESKQEKEDAETKAKAAEKALEKAKKETLDKMKYADGNPDGDSFEDAEKAYKEGKLPIMYI